MHCGSKSHYLTRSFRDLRTFTNFRRKSNFIFSKKMKSDDKKERKSVKINLFK